jgi:hypothetical protein
MSVREINLQTGEETVRPYTPEELAAIANQPPAPIPSVVSMKQAQLALFRAGILDAVESAIAVGNREDQITWAKSQTVERSDPLVTNMAAALNLSSADLDNLFTLAATL